jgi:hypothetical protein
VGAPCACVRLRQAAAAYWKKIWTPEPRWLWDGGLGQVLDCAAAAFTLPPSESLGVTTCLAPGCTCVSCSGGGVSSHLIDHAPCPCLAVPYKYMGLEDGRDTADEEGTASPTSPMLASPMAAG